LESGPEEKVDVAEDKSVTADKVCTNGNSRSGSDEPEKANRHWLNKPKEPPQKD